MKATVFLSILAAGAVALPTTSTNPLSEGNYIVTRAPDEAQARLSNIQLSGNGCSFPDPENTLPILTNDPSTNYHNFTLAFYKNTMDAQSSPGKSGKVNCRATMDLHLNEDWKVTMNRRWFARGTSDGVNGNFINSVTIGNTTSLVRIRLSPGGPKKGPWQSSSGGNAGVVATGSTAAIPVIIEIRLEIFGDQSGGINIEAVDEIFEYSKKD